MRAPVAFAALLLVTCGDAPRDGSTSAVAAEDDGRIECRIGAARDFERFCTIERSEDAEGRTLTVRKPDGGFRRLRVTDDGRGVVAADGAEQAEVTIVGDDRIEVAIGGDTFRLPATVWGR